MTQALALSVPPELQVENLGTEFTGALESQEPNLKHMKKLLFKEPPTELHSWIPIYKPYIWTEQISPSFPSVLILWWAGKQGNEQVLRGEYLIQDAGMNMY